MPVYDYLCDRCGPFTAMRPMAECDASNDCPGCGSTAERAFLTAPHLATMSTERRVAHATNERSAHAPAASSSRHGPGCSCCKGPMTRRSVRGRNGAKSFPASRPWMISH